VDEVYNKKILSAIVAILAITAMLSTMTSAFAAHETPSITISPNIVKESASKVFTLTIKNVSGDKIDNIKITLPAGFSGLAAVAVIPKDNIVTTVDDNYVILPAGTIVTLTSSENALIYENTDVIRLKDSWIYIPATGENAKLLENGLVEVRQDTSTGDNLSSGDNVLTIYEKQLTLTGDNRLRLLADTQVIRVSDNVVKLPEDTLVEVVQSDNADGFDNTDNVKLTTEKLVSLNDNKVRAVQTFRVARLGAYEATVSVGTELELLEDNNVILPAGTVVGFGKTVTVTIPENTDVKRGAGENVDAPGAITQPEGWTFNQSDLTWTTDNETYMIAAGNSLTLPFGATTASSGGDFTFIITTEDNSALGTINRIRNVSVTVTVDNTPPTYTVSVSPTTVGAKATVKITVNASKKLAKLGTVYVAENESIENKEITMTSPDGITWVGTYVTSDNTQRDGIARVWIDNSGIEDTLGHVLSGWTSVATFTVDKLAPPTPSATYDLSTLPAKTNQSSLMISGYAVDNYLGVVENKSGMKVIVRVGTTVTEVTSGVDNRFNAIINLKEGSNEVGVQYVDSAGNKSSENVQTVFLDTKKPEIKMLTIAGLTWKDGIEIKDNQPKISLTITDPGYPTTGLGVENQAYSANVGFTVGLHRDDNTLITELTNALAWDKATGKFENVLPQELPDNWYRIYVIAGDNLNSSDNVVFRFKIDTKEPATWTPSAAENPVSGTTSASPKLFTTSTVSISGSGVEVGATVKVYVNGVEQTAARTTVDSYGRFTTNVVLPARTTAKIEVTLTDAAGNESDRVLYGYAIYRPTLPTPSAAENPLKDTTYTSPLVVRVTSIPISGSGVEIGATIKVYVNDKVAVSVVADAYGRWSANVPITAGEVNKVEVTVSDRAGNESDRVLYGYVMTDKSAPKVTISAPAAGTTTDKATIAVSGKVTKDAWETYDEIRVSAQVGLTSAPVPVASDGSFAVNVPLAEGANTIIVSAEDAAGNRDSASVTVERTVTPWGTYAIVLVVIALVLAAIAIFRKR
jgi:hypothetical protein